MNAEPRFSPPETCTPAPAEPWAARTLATIELLS